MDNRVAVLARSQSVGAVSRCVHGCIHVRLGAVTVTLSEEQYFAFVAMINESAANFELFRQTGEEFDFGPASPPVADGA